MSKFNQLKKSLPQALSEDEQNKLLNEYYATKNEDIKQKLLEHNLRLCFKAAAEVCTLYDMQDMVDQAFSISYEELYASLEKYDPSITKSFATYALPNMKHRVIRFLDNERYRKHTFIGSEVAIKETEVVDVFSILQDQSESSMQDQVASDLFKEDIIQFINKSGWGEKRQLIVKMYLGLEYPRQYTQMEISKLLNISRQLTSQIIGDSLKPIQSYIAKKYPYFLPANSIPKPQASLVFKTQKERDLYIFESFYGLNGRIPKSYAQLTEELRLGMSRIKKIISDHKLEYENKHNTKLTHTRTSTEIYTDIDKDAVFNDYFGLNGSTMLSKFQIISKYKLGSSPHSFVLLIKKSIDKAISEKKFTAEEIEELKQRRSERLQSDNIEKYKYVYCSYYGLENHESKSKLELAKEFSVGLRAIESWITQYKKIQESLKDPDNQSSGFEKF